MKREERVIKKAHRRPGKGEGAFPKGGGPKGKLVGKDPRYRKEKTGGGEEYLERKESLGID